MKIHPEINQIDPKLAMSELFSFPYRNKTYNKEDIIITC
jgi:hypothetical protein